MPSKPTTTVTFESITLEITGSRDTDEVRHALDQALGDVIQAVIKYADASVKLHVHSTLSVKEST